MEVPKFQVVVRFADIDNYDKIIIMGRSCFKVNIYGDGVKANL